MRSYLHISPFFAPMAQSGAKRAIQFARNMPNEGWMPVVLTAPVVEDTVDPQLAQAVPDNVPVYREYAGFRRKQRHDAIQAQGGVVQPRNARAKSLKRANPTVDRLKQSLKLNAYFTPFDRYLWDVPAAVRAGTRLVTEHNIDVIYACGDPFTALYTGALIKQRTGKPLVLDLRDPFALHDGKMAMRPTLSARAVFALERWAFKRADKVILNTQACYERYVAHYESVLPKEHFTFIRNSFDRGLFQEVEPQTFEPYTIFYFGAARRFVMLDEFLRGFSKFVTSQALSADQVQFKMIGTVDAATSSVVEKHNLQGYVSGLPRITLGESMRYLSGADLLLMIIQEDCTLQIPGKLYDYLASGTPIVGVSANEEANRIVHETGAGVCVHGNNADEVAKALTTCYTRSKTHKRVNTDAVEAYSAPVAANALAQILEQLTNRKEQQ